MPFMLYKISPALLLVCLAVNGATILAGHGGTAARRVQEMVRGTATGIEPAAPADPARRHAAAGELERVQCMPVERALHDDRTGLAIALDKRLTKRILAFHGVQTPMFALVFRGRLEWAHDIDFPVIVKPAHEDGSIGIGFRAIAHSIKELLRTTGAKSGGFADFART